MVRGISEVDMATTPFAEEIWRVQPLSRGSRALRKNKKIGAFCSTQHQKTRLRSLRRRVHDQQTRREEDNSKELITERQSDIHS